jgi:hypothetical protein
MNDDEMTSVKLIESRAIIGAQNLIMMWSRRLASSRAWIASAPK